jgi:hypothetical protein
LRNRNGVSDALARSCYAQFALPPAMPAGAKPPTPKAKVRFTGGGVEMDVPAITNASVSSWLLQARNDRGEWDVQIKHAHGFLWNQKPAPSVVALRAMDKFGNLSDALVFQRTDTTPSAQTKPSIATPPRNAPSLRRGK